MPDDDRLRIHGGIDPIEATAHGVDPAAVVDFSVNINPYGPCAPVVEAARSAPLDRYPDASARAARNAWAEALGREPAEIAVGHGAADLFWAITRALVAPGQRVVIAEPTFSELRVAARSAGARVERVFAREEDALRLDLADLARSARGARLVYLCSPNNPTGEHVPLSAVRTLASALAGTMIVLDQSFLALSDHADELSASLPDNVLRVRSLTKELACPGLRIGLCVGAPALIARIEAARPTWATSSPALAALEAGARADAFVHESWLRMREDRDAVSLLLRARGFAPLPSATSYQLVPLASEARLLRAALFAHGVLVRDCASFGLPRHVRIAALPAAARAKLAAALDAIAPRR